MVYETMTHRPWSPDIRQGDYVRVSTKRACDGCWNLLGDPTDEEIQGAVVSGRIESVKSECGTCHGVHVVQVIPETPNVLGLSEEDKDDLLANLDVTYKVICPHQRTVAEGSRPCIMYQPCGCQAPEITVTEGATEENRRRVEMERDAAIERMIDQPCPASPTRQHRRINGDFMMPTAGCFVADHDALSDEAGDLIDGRPGAYPVDFEDEDQTGLVLHLIDQETLNTLPLVR